ncbi:PREDICTED: uncharacterized protein LOC105563832 [Vollenhovia emeryi]|uniref:uncharacterized protein LOC105563832 n=1 Tax=Vollenhovia emeryi TaxID=411798 RepID=UPI0005F3EDA8|nr:PREDICTED: uncharacterized protein LOC105563832 [Vollenhovia emeryi]
MAPPTLRKWVALQSMRLKEMRLIQESFRGRDSATLSKSGIQPRLERLNEIWADVCNTHGEISAKEGSESDPYMMDDMYATLHTTCEEVRDLLLTLREPFEVGEIPATSGQGANAGSSKPDADASIARLPRMPLPTFSGEYEDWASFCDLFTALVHEVPQFADVTKLQFLKSCLTGPAAELIKEVETTNANYASTWLTLKARYHNPRLILAKYLTSLSRLQPLRKESAVGLRAFTDEATRIVRALTNTKRAEALWDQWLVHSLSERLDTESRRLWEAELSVRDQQAAGSAGEGDIDPLKYLPTFTELVAFLERRVQTLHMLSSESLANKGEKRTAHDSKPVHKTQKVFHASSSSSTSDKLKCIACSGPHSLTKCASFKAKSANDRRDCVRRSGVCYNCFGGHRVNDCRSDKRCGVSGCQRKHHTLLHPSAAAEPIGEGRDLPTGKSEVDVDAKPVVVGTHSARASPLPETVLLATAQVGALSSSGETIRVRALLDQGSEASFVSESIAQLLELPRRPGEISLRGINGSRAGAAHSITRLVLSSLVGPRSTIEIDALVLSRLTAPLPACSLKERVLPRFQGLPLADPQFAISNPVDLILGADAYGQILKPGVKHWPASRLVAQNTVFGWVVSGAITADPARRAVPVRRAVSISLAHCSTDPDLSRVMERFWDLE